MCWYITGSPPPAALKKLVAKNLSVSSMVTAPASTGITAISRNAVISQVQAKIGIFSRSMPGARMLSTVAITLIAPMIELMPIMWMAKMLKATFAPPCSDSGGYMVQPDAGAPPGRNRVISSIAKANGRIQNDQLFMRGSAMSGAPICSGIIQFASPTKAGMIAPKIITSACMVVIWLKKCGLTACRPGIASSVRITTEKAAPMIAIRNANPRYRVPMSLWLVEKNQRSMKPCLWPWASWWSATGVVAAIAYLCVRVLWPGGERVLSPPGMPGRRPRPPLAPARRRRPGGWSASAGILPSPPPARRWA